VVERSVEARTTVELSKDRSGNADECAGVASDEEDGASALKERGPSGGVCEGVEGLGVED